MNAWLLPVAGRVLYEIYLAHRQTHAHNAGMILTLRIRCIECMDQRRGIADIQYCMAVAILWQVSTARQRSTSSIHCTVSFSNNAPSRYCHMHGSVCHSYLLLQLVFTNACFNGLESDCKYHMSANVLLAQYEQATSHK
jgi:hypothetical protein